MKKKAKVKLKKLCVFEIIEVKSGRSRKGRPTYLHTYLMQGPINNQINKLWIQIIPKNVPPPIPHPPGPSTNLIYDGCGVGSLQTGSQFSLSVWFIATTQHGTFQLFADLYSQSNVAISDQIAY